MSLVHHLCTSLLVAGAAFALPGQLAPLTARAVDPALLSQLDFFSQYAASAYCPGNNNSTGTKITCLPGLCPALDAANTNSLVEFEDSLLTDATGFVATDTTHALTVVSFRGSQSLRNWITNLSFFTSSSDICAGCRVHSGFWSSWIEARAQVLTAIKAAKDTYPSSQLVVVGHSLGGAIATLAAAELRKSGYVAELYTYGAPRIGNAAVSDFISAQPGGTFRVTHVDDPVPRLPPAGFTSFRHVSPEHYITSGNDVPVTANDVVVLQGNDNQDGANGDSAFDIDAHRWYFRGISSCGDGDLELKI